MKSFYSYTSTKQEEESDFLQTSDVYPIIWKGENEIFIKYYQQ